jgi:tetratricopeptide (TPR) repeat protein
MVLWDTLTGGPLLRLESGGTAAWSHDEKRIAVISDRRIRIHDASRGYELAADSNHQLNRAQNHSALARSLVSYGDYLYAMRQHDLALQLAPTDSTIQWSAGWLLANCSDQRIRDPRRALELATSATKSSPDSIEAWQVLGWALYRTGDWAGSITALHKSMELQGDGGDPRQWFFLAMAEWQRGNRDAARDWYAKSTAWLEKNPHAEVSRFRDEAEKLIDPR